MSSVSLGEVLERIPGNASEPIVSHFFVPPLLEVLGFQHGEICPEYNTGSRPVDYAARKCVGDDIFTTTKSNPYLLLEIKGREINLSEGSAQYKSTVAQIRGYLLAANCKTAQWGIITNSVHIQLFRKHGKVVFPATPCLEINLDNVDEIVADIKKKIEKPSKALTVTIYNNKGGVGKTTTTINLASILTLHGKKVLVVDFDPNQQDLTNSIGFPLSEGVVLDCLVNKNAEIRSAITPFTISNNQTGQAVSFDIIPADKNLVNAADGIGEIELRQKTKPHSLREKLDALKDDYDYILIDSPPNWRFFSQQALYAADVILIPTKHNNLFSLENAATTMKQFIPEVQAARNDGGPVALPIFFNGEKITQPQLIAAQKEIGSILERAKREGFNLLPHFFPLYTKARKNCYVFELPSYAHIANAAFARIPAVYRDRTARDYYSNLAKEYFLQ